MKKARCLAVLLALALIPSYARAQTFKSHAPRRPLHQPSSRPMEKGPAYYVAPNGDDANPGTEAKPWRTINASLRRLSAGDTLCLRGGNYFEDVYCAIAGTREKPITLRSYPGEVATIDGGMPEFQTDPAGAWKPFEGGAEGEYVSTKAYKNIRDVVGLFGDSNVGLQTYWYLMDLRAENEAWIPDPDTMIKPVWCGPGIFYDKQTGLIHCRLAHTKLEFPEKAKFKLDQYAGETDPRKLPLVIAPFNGEPLLVDQAMFVRFQDLVIRGAGYVAVDLRFGVGIEFDNCTIYCGTYGIWSKNTGPLKMTNCGVYGMIAPWAFRDENISYAYSSSVYPPFIEGAAVAEIAGSTKVQPKQITRHIARMPTHAVLVTAGGYEFETFYTPLNHDWDISYCEFTDGHDGVYPSGRDIRFHHNWVDNMQDDGIYLSGPTPYISDKVYIYENLISTCITALAAHARGGPGGDIYVYRNVIDMRGHVQNNRPSPKRPEGNLDGGSSVFGVHNGDHIIHMERMYFYQNTCLYPVVHQGLGFTGAMIYGWDPDTARRVFNNLFVFYGLGGKYPMPFYGYRREKADLQADGNEHWSLTAPAAPPADWLKPLRENKISELNKAKYPAGMGANDFAADPKFVKVSIEPGTVNDYQLQPGSPAIGKGVALPPEWPDPLRPKEGNPDIGAIPAGGAQLKVGINGRIAAGTPGEPK